MNSRLRQQKSTPTPAPRTVARSNTFVRTRSFQPSPARQNGARIGGVPIPSRVCQHHSAARLSRTAAISSVPPHSASSLLLGSPCRQKQHQRPDLKQSKRPAEHAGPPRRTRGLGSEGSGECRSGLDARSGTRAQSNARRQPGVVVQAEQEEARTQDGFQQ
jgi:hypothetical protein